MDPLLAGSTPPFPDISPDPSLELVAGVDEVGRGPCAGPVVAAAVILDPRNPVPGLRDSKKLSPKRRQQLDVLIRERAIAWSLGRAEAEEVDSVNVLQASLLAMARAVGGLAVSPRGVLVDGRDCPEVSCPVKAIIGGDVSEPAISAASIIAKVARDAEMVAMDARFPAYGFAAHKGYPTRAHLDALRVHGPCVIHRRSYRPVREALKARPLAEEGALPG